METDLEGGWTSHVSYCKSEVLFSLTWLLKFWVTMKQKMFKMAENLDNAIPQILLWSFPSPHSTITEILSKRPSLKIAAMWVTLVAGAGRSWICYFTITKRRARKLNR